MVCRFPRVPSAEPAQATSAVEELARDPASRRRFLRSAGGTAAAASFAAFLAACGSKKEQLTPGGSNPKTGAGVGTDRYGPGDLGIAIYALTLEYFETDFYAKAIASGQLKGKLLTTAQRFAAQEGQHVKALEAFITKIGGKLPQKPQTKFTFDTPGSALQMAVTFENLGAGAYLGQADRIGNKELLATAITIHSVEARHAAALSVAAKQNPAPDGAFATPQTAFNVITAIQPNLV
jgi:Ferritin-like domain